MRPSHLSINLSNLSHNFKLTKDHVSPAKVMAVVKANAYGHGLIECAKNLETAGADYLGVAFIEEGITLREAGIKTPIITLGGISGRQIDLFLEYQIDCLASSLSKLQAIEEAAKSHKKAARIHIKIDTGMERLGVHYYSPDLKPLIERALLSDHLDLCGISTHFANSELIDTSFMMEQLSRFQEAIAQFSNQLPKSCLLHAANSGALLSNKETHLGMVRPGRILYGIPPADHLDSVLSLKPCLSLLSEVVYFKVVREGATVSYGRTWTAKEDTRVVTIPLGYGDGLARRYSNGGEVLIRGKRYPIVGTINMDQFMVNLGPKGEAYNGDIVTVIGKDGDDIISVRDIANTIATDPLEVLTSLNSRLPRDYNT